MTYGYFRILGGGAFLACLLAFSPAKGLDLTPHPGFRDLEGVKIPIVQMQEGTRKIVYQPPPDWRVDGSPSELHLYSPGSGQGWMKLMCVDKGSDASSVGTLSADALQAQAKKFLPEGVQEVALKSEVTNPFTLQGHAAEEFIFSYLLFASRDTASISVLDWNEKQWLVVIISAADKDFEALHGQAIASLFSWRPVPGN